MARKRSNNQYGTITNDPLTAGATSISSAEFADLPTVAGSDELIISLDTDESAGAMEIVKCTAHAAASTVITVTRAQFGTSARQHSLGTRWRHSAYDTDFVYSATSTTLPTVGLFEGAKAIQDDKDREVTYDGSNWIPTSHYSANGRIGVELTNGGTSLTSGVATIVTWTVETSDLDGFITVSSTTMVVPTGADGWYGASLKATFTTTALGINSGFAVAINNIIDGWTRLGPNINVAQVGSWQGQLVAGQTMAIYLYQDGGSTVSCTPRLRLYRLNR